MSEINVFSPAVCGTTNETNMDLPRPGDTLGCGSFSGSVVDDIAQQQAGKTASAIRSDTSDLDPADIAEFQEHRLSARLSGREFFAHEGQVFDIHSRYSDVVNNNPSAMPGLHDITMNTTDFNTLEIQDTDNSPPVMPDGMGLLPIEPKDGEDSATTELRAEVSDFQARRLASRLNGQDFFMHNGQQLSIHDHYIDYRISIGDVDAKPQFPQFVESVEPGFIIDGNGVEQPVEELSPLPSDASLYNRNV